MTNLDSASILIRLGEASARVRAASSQARPDDVLDVLAEQARLLAGARHAWAASLDGSTIVSLRSTSDDSSPPSTGGPPPFAALLGAAHPIARASGYVACALHGSGPAPEGIVVVKVDAANRGDLDAPTFDLAFGQLATIAGLALECARLRQRVESVTKARESLLASISHDLRNPLNTFAMSAGLLRDDLERNDVDGTRGIALVSRMERATSRMQGMIEDLVEASRVDARKIDFNVTPLQAAQVVRDAVAAAAPVASEKGASVTVDAVDEDVRVMADRSRTLQLIAKVVAFEAKSTGDGGSIRLGVRRQGDSVVFTARAFGPGGMQVSPPEEGRGGLSLLLARGLVEAQKGAFRIDGGDGLTVSFTLPAAKT
jgi:K+-sensing histidine kinase KdpD